MTLESLDSESIARDVPIGVTAGGQILSVAPLARARRGRLGGAAGGWRGGSRRGARHRRRGDAMVYVVDLERVAPNESRAANGGGGGGRFRVYSDDASDDDASDDDASDVS